MILLDTNVVSEVMKARPAESVVTWLNRQDSGQLSVSAITVGEIVYGRQLLPDGQIAAIARRDHLAVATRNVRDFEHCGIEVLDPFDPEPK